MKKKLFAVLLFLALSGILTACGGANYADGTYTGQSAVLDEADGGYGVATITIADNVITECAYQSYRTDGTLKDGDYGKEGGEIANRDYYNKAQKAVLACQDYAEQLAETGDLDEVDVISGATISYDQFLEAVEDALSQAREG